MRDTNDPQYFDLRTCQLDKKKKLNYQGFNCFIEPEIYTILGESVVLQRI